MTTALRRSVRILVACLTGSAVVGGITTGTGSATTATATGAGSSGPPGYVAIVPQRIVDTRIGLGAPDAPLNPSSALAVDIPTSIVPVDAIGVALTVTTDVGAAPGFVTAYACNGIRPLASLVNQRPDEARSNQAILPLDASRKVCLFANTPVDAIVDVTGWLAADGDPFHPLTPYRAFDTRFGPRPDGNLDKPVDGEVLEIPLAGANGVAAGATAVAANITMTDAEAAGFVRAYPCGGDVPETSTGNVPQGGTRAVFTFVGLGSGKLCVFVEHAANVIVDISGYFGTGSGVPVHPATPRRILDTRLDGGGPLKPFEERVVRLGVPVGTTMAASNVTAADGVAAGWVRLAPCGSGAITSTVNYVSGMSIADLTTTVVGGEESVCLTANTAVHVVVDEAAASTEGTVAAFEVNQPMYPQFRPDIVDYVLRCAAGVNQVSVRLAVEPGGAVQLDGQAPVTSSTSSFPLSSGQAFVASFTGPGGNATYRVRCLPPDFPDYNARRLGNSASGWYLLTPNGGGNYVTLFDRDGAPVWWFKDAAAPADAKVVAGQKIAWNYGGSPFNLDPAKFYKVHALDGTVVDEVKAVGQPTDYHDMIFLSNGNRLVSSYVPREHVDLTVINGGPDELVLDDHLQEVTPGGSVVWEWHSDDHIDVAEAGIGRFALPDGRTAADIIHMNSMQEDGTGFVVSSRHMDAVFRIDKASGNLTWKLGGRPHTRSPGVKNLAFVGDPYGNILEQHDARILPDGTLTLHDNRIFWNGDVRAVRYQLDIVAGTATMLEEIKDTETYVSFYQGSARRTAAGTWVVMWGGSNLLTETDPSGQRLFEIRLKPQTTSYRGVPVAPGELTRDAVAAGMDAQHPR